MQRKSLLIATLLVSGLLWHAARAIGSEPAYSLSCTSLWTTLNNASLTIKTEPFTDMFWIDAAQNTINGVPGAFTDSEISWDNEAMSKKTVSADRTTHLVNKVTGKYTVLVRSFNPIDGKQDISEYVGKCARYIPQ